jgi:hypothetical protein
MMSKKPGACTPTTGTKEIFSFLLCGKHPWIDFEIKIADRFRNENRSAIFPEWFLIAITIAISI